MALLAEYGYWGLFLSSFLAATLLPLGSEVVMGVLLGHDFNPYGLILLATIGNVLGAVVNYLLGRFGSRILMNKFFRLSDTDIKRAEGRFKTYGSASLLFAWVPVVGDPLTVAAGVLKVNFTLFLLLVGVGKFLRYLAVCWAVLSI